MWIKKKSLLYVADFSHVSIFNLNLEILSSWPLSVSLPLSRKTFRGIKADENLIYLTISGINQIFLCDRENGKVYQKWGQVTSSSEQGNFNWPLGITVADLCVYICDCDNHRVQIFRKENGNFVNQWGKGSGGTMKMGQFNYPCCIHNDASEELFYIGDRFCVQIWEKNGICLQRIDDGGFEFSWIYGVCVMNDRLYVSDDRNGQIQIFKRGN